MATQQFDPIYHGLSSEVGKFRVAPSGMAWKGVNSAEMTAIKASDIKWAQWLRVARNYQLRVGLANHQKETFDGFQREDHDQLANILKNHFAITLETKEVSFRGWNWGVTDFQGKDLAFTVSDRTAFELPLENVTNANIAGKTEVSLEFSTPSGSKPVGDEMTEIRFYVPGTHSKIKDSDAGSNKSDAEDDDEEVSAAQAFHEQIKEKSGTDDLSGKLILSFEDVLIPTPRGRYDMDMGHDFFRLRGKTYDYKILYASISRLFLLPKDDLHVLFILSLNIPIRQGQTRYQFLVMHFSREEEITAELNMSEEDIAKYDRLKKNYEDPTFEVVSSIFRALSSKKIIGSGSFQSREGLPGVKAHLKAVPGDLFFLEKYLFFVSKQPTLIELSEIYSVTYSRINATSRTFDMKVVTRSGPEHSFTNIIKEEHEPTETYLKEKKVKVKNETVPDAELLMAAAVGDDDDDEMASISSDDDDGRQSKPSRTKGADDDSEEDEDFEASSSDAGSPTESDSSDGGAATASDASGDKEVKQSKKAKKKKAKDSNKDKNAADSDADEDAAPKKSAPKPKPKKKKTEDAMDVDGGDDAPKAKKSKSKAKGDDAMDVDDKPKPKPKPKPKAKPKNDDDEEPPKKKTKTS